MDTLPAALVSTKGSTEAAGKPLAALPSAQPSACHATEAYQWSKTGVVGRSRENRRMAGDRRRDQAASCAE